MIICSNCNHQNPEGSVQCENCYAALPSSYSCPNCGASVQTNATFCGQCGFNLQKTKTISTAANNPFDNNNDYALEDDSIPTTSINSGFEASPWDMDEDLSSTEEPLEEQLLSFDEELAAASYDESLELGQVDMEDLSSTEEQLLSFDEELAATSYDESLELGQMEMEDLSSTEEPLEEQLLSFDEELAATSYDEELELGQMEMEDLSSTEEPLEEQLLSFDEELAAVSDDEFLLETTEEIEELSNNTEETEDIEAWISSVEEESALENDEFEEVSDLVEFEEEIETNPQYAILEAETTEIESSEPETIEFVAATESVLETDREFATEEIKSSSSIPIDKATEIQIDKAILFHIQTGTQIEIPTNTETAKIGKPNSQVIPDIDVSSFPNSEIVSRIHGEIKVVENKYYIEDRGSSNGTYINNSPLLTGNSHCLKNGDRISLGKGDLVTFIFQLR